ncbi:hypothetical protein MNV49_000484 [Pseudohyphozyma bogoriensis]|nr:hypothetical protein MNV49_000484 [Pseudohyphozyma bogoriensis]
MTHFLTSDLQNHALWLGPARQLALPYLTGFTNFPSFASTTSSLHHFYPPILFSKQYPSLDEFMDDNEDERERRRAWQRLASLDRGNTVWHETTVPNALSGATGVREVAIKWIWVFDPTPYGSKISPSSRFLAALLFSLFFADYMRIDLPRSDCRQFGMGVAMACLHLAIKFDEDFTAPNYVASRYMYVKAPIYLGSSELLSLERKILRSPSIHYTFPSTPFDYLYELVRAVPFLQQLALEQPNVWAGAQANFETFLEAATSCQDFLRVHAKLLTTAALILAIRHLAFDDQLVSTAPSPFSLASENPASSPSPESNYYSPLTSPMPGDSDAFSQHPDSHFISASSSQGQVQRFVTSSRSSQADEMERRQWEWEKEVVSMEKATARSLEEVLRLKKDEIAHHVDWLESLYNHTHSDDQ